MIKLILVGCNGYMGKVVTDLVSSVSDMKIVAGFDTNTAKMSDYHVYAGPNESSEDADVIIDFSMPSALDALLKFATSRKLPLVLCATGYTPKQIADIETASNQIPVFRSGNMSLGINLLADLIKRACAVLGEDFDVEIIEKHHRRKIDAPSGTALMLADAASAALPYTPEYVYERESKHTPRDAKEIGISAVRGGTIVGVHEVIFAGQDEVIELNHIASSRTVFANGAIKAARFMLNKPPGLFDMTDVLS